jgi:hypothetical protein
MPAKKLLQAAKMCAIALLSGHRRVHDRLRGGREDRMGGNRMEAARAGNVGRPDETLGRAEIHNVTTLVNGPTEYWSQAVPDRPPTTAPPTYASNSAAFTVWRFTSTTLFASRRVSAVALADRHRA